MSRRHAWEDVATELAEWLESMSNELADGLMAGGSSPFGSGASEDEKLDYYESQVFMPPEAVDVSGQPLPPDTPNHAGRAALLERVGVDSFVEIMNAVAKRRKRRLEAVGAVMGRHPELLGIRGRNESHL